MEAATATNCGGFSGCGRLAAHTALWAGREIFQGACAAPYWGAGAADEEKNPLVSQGAGFGNARGKLRAAPQFLPGAEFSGAQVDEGSSQAGFDEERPAAGDDLSCLL